MLRDQAVGDIQISRRLSIELDAVPGTFNQPDFFCAPTKHCTQFSASYWTLMFIQISCDSNSKCKTKPTYLIAKPRPASSLLSQTPLDSSIYTIFRLPRLNTHTWAR